MGVTLYAGVPQGSRLVALRSRFKSWEGAESPTLSYPPVVHGSLMSVEGLWSLCPRSQALVPSPGIRSVNIHRGGGAESPARVGTAGAMVLGTW